MLTITAKTTSSLNLRSGPGTSYSVLTVIPTQTNVQMQNAQYDGRPTNWYPVQYGGKSGWCSGDYLMSPGRKGDVMKMTEQEYFDSLFRHYGEPYIWGINDCSQQVVDRWCDAGFYPEDGFLDAEADEMFENFRSGRWDGIPQDPTNPEPMSCAFYAPPDQLTNVKHVQNVVNERYGITARGGGSGTTSPKPGAEVAIAPLLYRPDIYVIAAIYLPVFRFKP